MCTLDIIIPQYKESNSILERLLTSIYNQKNIDFNQLGIIFINDCSPSPISMSLIQKFSNLKIQSLKTTKNVGPGLARQFGIDHSTADYITFLDADDMYYSDHCFEQIFQILEQKKPTILLTKWVEEIFDSYGNSKQIMHTSDIIFLHGKVIKRSYLIENNIRFSPKLRLHEDSYFCTILLLSTQDILSTEVILNYWRYRKDSLVREKKEYHYLVRTFKDLLICNKEVARELEQRNHPYKNEYIIKAIVYLYCILASYFFENKKDKKLQSLKKEYEKLFFLYLSENLDIFHQTDSSLVVQYMNEQMNMFIHTNSNMGMKETWTEFITRLTNEYVD